jgi:glucose-1-phosphate adenylyltransferase
MAADPTVLAFVMAGGEGSRLRPLTTKHCKPAVPFNTRHRIVDFVLSNLVNSGIHANYLLVQYQAPSLVEHVQQAWSGTEHAPTGSVTVVPPRPAQVFRGTADAVAQNIDLIHRHRPEVVAVFGADHIYRMDVRQMIAFHRDCGADATVAAVPVCLSDCHQFGIVETDDAGRITDFREKPKTATPMRGSTTHALASMGNYIFNADVLLAALEAAQASGATDFGKDILPAMVASHRLAAYDFHTNEVPGVAAHEERGYWRDVGTIDAYFQAHLDTLGTEPRFNMHNPLWPIHGLDARQANVRLQGAQVLRSIVGAGSYVEGASLEHSLLRSSVRVERGARLDRCVVMDRARIGAGAQLRRAIVAHDNDVPPGERIGFDLERDRQRFQVTDSGVVVVPAGFFAPRPVTVSLPKPSLASLPFLMPQRGAGREAGSPLGMAA